MSTLIKEVRLIKVEQAEENNNKWWNAQLFDDGTVKAQWGRVGYDGQSGEWDGGGSYLDKKVREKLKKGYVEQKTIGGAVTSNGGTVKIDTNLREIAKKDLLKDSTNTALAGLVDRLVKANIHKITAATTITYNNTTGLFSTPLGIVTPDGINEARDILAEIHPLVKADKFTALTDTLALKYLRIIPQHLGMGRFNAGTIFPDETAIQKQSDILDSLEASYQAMTTSPTPKADSKPTESGVFKVDINILASGSDYTRLANWFDKSKKPMHRSVYGMRVKQIYTVSIHDMTNAFETKTMPVQEVWHGTSQANLLSILRGGLKKSPPATAVIAGKMFGNGIYGADVSTKALNYSMGNWGQGGVGDAAWLFVCQFAMGRTQTVTRQKLSGADSGYDSIYAKGGYDLYNDEFIVYRNSQVKITHLLECK